MLKEESFEIFEEDSKVEICKKTNLIIDKYHQLSEDDSEFYKLILTMDEGPFWGLDMNTELEQISEVLVDDYVLIIRGNESEKTLELVDKDGELKWRKIMARSSNYKFERLKFAVNPIRVKDDLGYKIALSGDGELIQLYLRKNGGFRLFFHSW